MYGVEETVFRTPCDRSCGILPQTYEIFETKPCSARLLLSLSLAGFVCGFNLLVPEVTGRLKRLNPTRDSPNQIEGFEFSGPDF